MVNDSNGPKDEANYQPKTRAELFRRIMQLASDEGISYQTLYEMWRAIEKIATEGKDKDKK